MGQLGTKAATTEVASARVHTWALAATAALGWALFTLTILHAISSFDPIADPISRYAFTDTGQGMLEASLLSFAVGLVAVRGALLAAGLAVSRTATILIVVATTGLVAAALFPATFTEDIDPVSGLIHQYASLLTFLSLPGIAVCLLDSTRGVEELRRTRRMLARLVWAALSGLVLFGLSYLADNLALGFAPLTAALSLLDAVPVGLLQRVVFLLDFLLLAGLLVLAHRAARSTARA
ncbi:DUF998 domain-containing protein [Saccharomonospora piscinae]|uniref:DUF998 domain-containing protein n=1 Tax=Saccharomonospora piscinae TaxID=687388 RepID=UPI000467282F|nr:DUF998 domain-containing protein [Saccharomonospora piscinae]